MDKFWHREHYACIVCGDKKQKIHEHEQKPYCSTHYKERTKSFCSWCKKELEGDNFILAHEQKWHTTCFYQAVSAGKQRKPSIELGTPRSMPNLLLKPLNSSLGSHQDKTVNSKLNSLKDSNSSTSPVLGGSPEGKLTIDGKKIIRKRIIRKIRHSKGSLSIQSPSELKTQHKSSDEDESSSSSPDINQIKESLLNPKPKGIDSLSTSLGELSPQRKKKVNSYIVPNSRGGSLTPEKVRPPITTQMNRTSTEKSPKSISTKKLEILISESENETVLPIDISRNTRPKSTEIPSPISKTSDESLKQKVEHKILSELKIGESDETPLGRLSKFLKVLGSQDKLESLKNSNFTSPESLYSLREIDLIKLNILNKNERNNFLKSINKELPKFIEKHPPNNAFKRQSKSKIENVVKNLLSSKNTTAPPKKRKFCIKCGNKLEAIVCGKCGFKNITQRKINKLNN